MSTPWRTSTTCGRSKGAGRYILLQLSIALPTLLGVVTLVFLIVRLIPGDPATLILGDAATPAALARLHQALNLDQPLPLQYARFLGDLLRGDLGVSMMTNQPVLREIAAQAPSTIQLALVSIVLGTLIGLPAGIVAAVKRGALLLDQMLMLLALVGATVPSFWLALLLILVFSAELGWLPAIGAGDGTLLGTLRALVLPALALAAILAGTLARITRSAMLEVLDEDYVRTAQAKGLAHAVVVGRHALRNAALPIVTVIGLQLANLLTGTVLVETVFVRQGLGNLVVQAVLNRDYPLVQGCVVVLAAMFVLVNLVVDGLYGYFDPRIRYG